MSKHFHAVVWLDHREAKIFGFGATGVDAAHVRAPDHPGHLHHKAGSPEGEHTIASKQYLTAVADGLVGYREILVVGPADTKTELQKFAREHVPELAARIMAVEALDHLTDGEILSFARKFFEGKDLATPQR